MKTIKFKKPVAIDIDGIARSYVIGDVRDYLSDDDCAKLVTSGDAEYVDTNVMHTQTHTQPEAEETEVESEIKPEAEEKLYQPKNKENKLMKPKKKANK